MSSSSPQPATKYYFAYGSNLHIEQMNKRCPHSSFIGKARLHNYRWHINERGYANVVASESHWVDGLLYEINQVDEARLDKNEGVSIRAYDKQYMGVLLHRADAALYRRPVSWIVEQGGPAAVCKQIEHGDMNKAPVSEEWLEDVLVYINPTYVTDSQPWDEYVDRMNLGIADALTLGVEDEYVRKYMRPFIPE